MKSTPARFKKLHHTAALEFYSIDTTLKTELPLFISPVSAGFPSPSEDYVDLSLDLNKHLIKHPAATFYVRVKGDSMKGAGICNGDVLIVDRALEPNDGCIVIGVINGEFTVKRIRMIKGELFLVPENSAYPSLKITEEHDFKVWGVVSYVIHKT